MEAAALLDAARQLHADMLRACGLRVGVNYVLLDHWHHMRTTPASQLSNSWVFIGCARTINLEG